MLDFYKTFIGLCNKHNVAPSKVAIECGLSKASVNRWKNGYLPTDANLHKISDFFGVSSDYFKIGSKNTDNIIFKYELSEKEKRLVFNYRNKPEMQSAVDRLLGIEEISQPKLYTAQVAAFGGDMKEITYTEEELEVLKEIKRIQNNKD